MDTYEKKYKEALEMAQKLYQDCPNGKNDRIYHTTDLEKMFPELKESEDEKTRKIIIALVNAHGQGMYKDDMLAWLENIPYTIDHEKREGFHLGYKAALEKQGTSYTKRDVDDPYLKGISDAKNELEKQGEQKPTDKVEPKFKVGDYIERKDGLGCHAKVIFVGKNVYGCEKLIYPKDSSPFFELMFENQDEFRISSDFQQAPAWSEEDETKLKSACALIKNTSLNGNEGIVDSTIDWLKSLKQRYTWKPSDEQMEALLYETEAWDEDSINGQNLTSLFNDLKKLKGE